MAFNFQNLNSEEIRQIIHDEINYDIANNTVYYSKRFNELGNQHYVELLLKHTENGTEVTLAEELKALNCFKEKEERRTAKGVSLVTVPETAPFTFAEGEFNRFYIRAVCLKALKEKKNISVYRARHSEKPRSESEALIGQVIDASQLLADLRNNIGIDTALGLPNGPNSGLSIKLDE